MSPIESHEINVRYFCVIYYATKLAVYYPLTIW